MHALFPSMRNVTMHLATVVWQMCRSAGYRDATEKRHDFVINAAGHSGEVWEALRLMHDKHGSFDDLVRKGGLANAHALVRSYIQLLSTSSDGQLLLMMLPDWCEYGFPVVSLGHKFAASLLVTRPPGEALSELQTPFRSFRIDVPNHMLFITDAKGNELDVATIYAAKMPHLGRPEPTWAYVAYTEAQTALWCYHHDISYLLSGDIISPDLPPSMKAFELDMTDVDSRASGLIGRLFVNTCLAMLDPARIKKIGKSHRTPATPGNNRECPHPTARVFEVSAPVRHNFKDAVATYLRKGGSSPSLQHVVAGHWKNQAHGPKMRDRKLIYVEPYWRGPEDAAIAVRPHKLL